MKSSTFFAGLLLLLFGSFAACNMSVNKSIEIADGEVVTRSLNTVNGNIYIGNEAVVKASSRTVNGRIEVGRDSEVGDLQCVNGGIRLAEKVLVRGDIETVNGSVSCESGVLVDGSVTSINGTIDLEKTEVKRDIKTYNGDIVLLKSSFVGGNIIVGDSKSSSKSERKIKITIGEDSEVDGDIEVRNTDVVVTVHLSKGGKVNGKIKGAEVVEE